MDTTTTDTPDTRLVTSIEKRRNQAAFAPLAQIEGYWNALRGTRTMPLRSEIDPRGLKGALEYCFVLERIAPGLARMRVAGSHMGDLMGMEVRGMPISSFLTAGSRQEFGTALEEVFQGPAVATVELSAETSVGRPELSARMILMPVKSDLGDVSRILGGFVTSGPIGRVPRRFNVKKITVSAIAGVEIPRPSTVDRLTDDTFRTSQKTIGRGAQSLPPFTPAPAFSEADARFEQPLKGVPYLRVVK